MYEQDRLAEYDWEIGDGESNDDEDEDEEQAEIEAARLGRLSSATKKKSQVNSSSTERTKIIDGWTAPSQHRKYLILYLSVEGSCNPSFIRTQWNYLVVMSTTEIT